MTAPTSILDRSASVTLNGSGNGQVQIGPTKPRVRWHVTSVGVQTSTAVKVPICTVYRSSGAMSGASYTGSQDSGSADEWMWTGQYLRAVWTGGDPGATATIYVYGIEVPG